MFDDFDVMLAREEHAQGMPVGQPGHCERCNNEVIQRRMRALVDNCRHEDWIDISTLDQVPGTTRICAVCGTQD